jgi:hypothetical protein
LQVFPNAFRLHLAKSMEKQGTQEQFFDFLFPEGRHLSYFPPTFPCFFLDATWMQCGKLTIRIFLFPSIQKNISLSPCAACNIAKNIIIQEYSTWCSLPSRSGSYVPSTFPYLPRWMPRRRATALAQRFSSNEEGM